MSKRTERAPVRRQCASRQHVNHRGVRLPTPELLAAPKLSLPRPRKRLHAVVQLPLPQHGGPGVHQRPQAAIRLQRRPPPAHGPYVLQAARQRHRCEHRHHACSTSPWVRGEDGNCVCAHARVVRQVHRRVHKAPAAHCQAIDAPAVEGGASPRRLCHWPQPSATVGYIPGPRNIVQAEVAAPTRGTTGAHCQDARPLVRPLPGGAAPAAAARRHGEDGVLVRASHMRRHKRLPNHTHRRGQPQSYPSTAEQGCC
jgi:hypothetical protein